MQASEHHPIMSRVAPLCCWGALLQERWYREEDLHASYSHSLTSVNAELKQIDCCQIKGKTWLVTKRFFLTYPTLVNMAKDKLLLEWNTSLK